MPVSFEITATPAAVLVDCAKLSVQAIVDASLTKGEYITFEGNPLSRAARMKRVGNTNLENATTANFARRA